MTAISARFRVPVGVELALLVALDHACLGHGGHGRAGVVRHGGPIREAAQVAVIGVGHRPVDGLHGPQRNTMASCRVTGSLGRKLPSASAVAMPRALAWARASAVVAAGGHVSKVACGGGAAEAKGAVEHQDIVAAGEGGRRG